MEWISTKEKPIPSQEFVLAGMYLKDGTFEYRLICIDERGNIRGRDWEYDDTWDIKDYTLWSSITAPPEETQ